MSEYELVKKLGSYDNFKGLKSMVKVPRHKLFARNKLSAPTVKNYSHDNLLKETELKAALTGSTRRAKGSPPKKAQWLKKEKTLTIGSKLEVAEGEDVEVDEGVDG